MKLPSLPFSGYRAALLVWVGLADMHRVVWGMAIQMAGLIEASVPIGVR